LLIVKPYNRLTIPLQLPLGDGETKVEIGIQRIDGEKFTMTANDKTFIYNGDNYTYSYPQDVVVFNLMNTIKEKEVRVELTPGTYKLESVKIHYNSYGKLNTLISERKKESLQNVMIEKDSIIGEIELETDGFLFMSVPYSKGWNIIVDGQPVESMKVQSTFIGIPLEKGNHKLEMQFRSPLLLEGFLLSLFTLFALVFWSIWKKSRKRKE
ncbi:MAG: YfhO family protein, partial [Melioribacteraceae bacterium]|nr:YfhO family protein [Melioribacteraceae bacterium]